MTHQIMLARLEIRLKKITILAMDFLSDGGLLIGDGGNLLGDGGNLNGDGGDLHVGYLVFLHVGHYGGHHNVLLTLCEE